MASERRVARVVSTALLLLASAAPAGAQQPKGPSASDRETARALMDDGRSRTLKGDLKGALAAYSGADAIMHVPTTGLAVARTQAALGLLVEARDTALGVTRIPVTPKEPPVVAEGRKQAETLANELSPRIPTVSIAVKVPTGFEPTVTVDELEVPYAALVAPRRLNPGHHAIVARVGTVERRAEVDLLEKDAKSVSLEFPSDMKAPAKPVAVVPVESKPVGEPPSSPTKRGTSPLVYVGITVGGLGLLTGLGAGFFSYSKTQSANDQCADKQCPPAAHDDLDTATTMAVVSNIGFIVAGAGAATTVLGILMSGNRREAKPATAQARPYVGPGQLGVTGSF